MKRIILLDASLKCWGTPKTMAHAVMLAIARHPKSDFESEVFAVGNSVKPLAVDSRDEILEGLLSLESALSANEGLNEFFKEHAPSSTQQIILITSKEAVRSKELQQALSHHGANINFRIATDVDGSIALHKNQGKSLKHVQDIKLPLERLWERSLAPEQAPKEVERQLVEHMPILNPSPNLFKSAFVSDDGQYYVVTKKGDLLRLYQPNQDLWNSGWEQINGSVKIPPGLHDAGTTSDGELVVICYIPQQKVVHIVNLTTQKILKISFAKNTRSKYFEERKLVNQFLFFQDAFHCHTDHKNWTITLAGKVYEGSTATIEHLEKRLSDNKTRMGHLGFQSVLRNPKSVWISTDGNLVLNMHHLVIDHHRGLIWETNHSGNAEIYARHIDKDAFEFSNGCRIEMNHHGVCRLTGYDQVPDIYIPTPIDYALGVATEAEFAGNPYFRKHTLHRLTLIEPAKDKLNTVKTLSKDAQLSLTKSKVIVTEAPTEIGAFGITVARNIKDSLELIGAKVAMEDDYTVTPLSQIEITTEEFYKKYIKRFIQNVRNHGT
jgi:ribosomal protein L7/L12